ncbi:MAG: helix-turn-helix domain-containing protein [Pricia sp.]
MRPKGAHHDENACKKARRAVRDTLDVVGGKWKLVLISILREGTFRFNELAKLAEISPRILSKELKELEMNDLVERKVIDTRPVTVEYSLTPYSESLSEVVMAMRSWGIRHREKIIGK